MHQIIDNVSREFEESVGQVSITSTGKYMCRSTTIVIKSQLHAGVEVNHFAGGSHWGSRGTSCMLGTIKVHKIWCLDKVVVKPWETATTG